MMKTKIVLTTLMTLFLNGMGIAARTDNATIIATADTSIVSATQSDSITGTKQQFLPTAHRIDRGINDIVFAYRGEMSIGLAASYGTISSDDTNLMLLIEGIQVDGSVFTLDPSFGYFIRDNICIGARFGYTKMHGRLDNAALNLGSANDMSFALSGLELTNQITAMGAFVRSYAGVDPNGHFGLFAEMELVLRLGNSMISSGAGESADISKNNLTQARLLFNTGAAVYIFPNVCCSISFGLGGINFSHIEQTDGQNISTGFRNTSKMLFKLNLTDIKIGLNFYL